MSLIEQINGGVGRLHKLHGVSYDNLFQTLCDDNGFEDDDAIVDELETDIGESQLADLDLMEGICPWINGDEDTRVQEIFDIFKQCWKDPNAFSSKAALAKPLQVESDNFMVSKEDIDRATQMVKDQAPVLFDGGFSGDECLCRMLAVAMKMNKNYLLFLVDMFLRELLYHHYKHRNDDNPKPFDAAEWQKQNKHLVTLKNLNYNINGQSADELVKAAVNSYLHRVAPKVMLKPPHRIVYSVKTVAQYIEQTINFVQVMASKKMSTCPFQYDSVYAFQQHTDTMDEDPMSGDDDDDEEENGGDDPNGGGSMSQIGDIKQGLIATKLHFKQAQWDHMEQRNYRPLNEAYDKLSAAAQSKQFPQHHRFCSILDLRKGRDDGKGGGDEKDDGNLFVFEPEAESQKIHKNAMALNFFHNSKHSIIPNPKPSGDEKENEPMLSSATTGPQIMLSFHVEAEDNMRCYFYINGQCTRFLPEDLRMLLPLFFEESEENLKFVKGEGIKQMIAGLEGKLRDDQFRVFLKDNKVECPYQKELLEEAAKGGK